jgi:simple sugar transport system ATP-binding protein
VLFAIEKKKIVPGGEVLRINDVKALNDKGLPALRGVSLSVRSREIVGLAGVAGNGQRELTEVITGLRRCTGGQVLMNGEDITNKTPRIAIQKSISHVPEDRTLVGTAPNLSVTDNIIMKKYNQAPIGKGWTLNTVAAERYASELKTAYDIIAPSIDTPVRLLSGGNLQRVILAREISSKPTLMVAMQPTRGLDVGAIESVHRLLLAQREAGTAILLVSEELEELLSLSDRLFVIYEGEIMGEVLDGNIEHAGLMMTGTRQESIAV